MDAAEHLEQLRRDARTEILQRIEQRDKFSIQLTIALAAIVAFSYSEQGSPRMLFAAPIASLYYTVLILYSYAIHDVLAEYLRDRIEPDLAAQTGVDPSCGWETHYFGKTRPGIRWQLFLWAHWAIAIGTSILAIYDRIQKDQDPVVDIFLMTTILLASLVVATPPFWSRSQAENSQPRSL
ncbi:MAG: hypothetical protein DWQ29_04530 [Planctomycetota bacterium]|nr:MAG: hypothetical protein DWQ29_04530 [Planctomycetota bacterium]